MFKLDTILDKFRQKQKVTEVKATALPENSLQTNVKTWYDEKYETVVIQRNLFLGILLISLLLSVISLIVIAFVINAKKFDPFVIQLDDTTGATKVVNPLDSDVLIGNDAIAQYFIKKYVSARETYNPVDFDTGARNTIRLLSTNAVYWSYVGYLRNDATNPAILYGPRNTTYMTIKSWSKLSDKKFMVRFSIRETDENMLIFNKIAVVEFKYTPMELSEQERDVNPIGFQVIGYRVDDDKS